MKLVSLSVENFRCYQEPVKVEFDDLTALVGRNDVGKSSLMDALAIFFDHTKPDQDDASKSGEASKMEITCEFSHLPDEAVLDAAFNTTLEAEFLLNARGNLEIKKTYNGAFKTVKLETVHAIANHPTAEGIADLLSLKKAELSARATELGADMDGVDKRKNAQVRAAIRETAADLQLQEREVLLSAEDGKQIWTALAPYLPAFSLFKSDRASTDQDAEAQDPLKAAIREALKEIEPILEEVKARVEAEVQRIADATVEKIREMDPGLAETLSPVITTRKWDSLFQTSITGEEGVPLNKRGSGVKRLVLLNFFRAKAEADAMSSDAPSVIYAIEEPETSQHPNNQRLLLSALRELASEEGRQVILTTHTPMLARYIPAEDIRFLEFAENGQRSLTHCDNEQVRNEIAKSLGVLPDHGVKIFLGVEGTNDINFLKGMSELHRSAGHAIHSFDELELQGELIFFPFGGSNLQVWISRLSPLNRPEYHIYDRDNPHPEAPAYQAEIDAVNARDNCDAVCTTKREMENYVHPEAIQAAYAANGLNVNLPAQFADFDDVPLIVAQALHQEGGETPWAELKPENQRDKQSRAKRFINSQGVQQMSADHLAETDPEGEIAEWLTSICSKIDEQA